MMKFLKNLLSSDESVAPEDAFVKILKLMASEEDIQKLVNKILSLPHKDRISLITNMKNSPMPTSQYEIIRHLADDEFCKKILSVQINR